MKALVVGLGSIGRRHLDNLRQLVPEADLAVLRRPESEERPLPTGVRTLQHLADALSDCPELAILASPAPRHIDVAQELARAGCHLLVEKPLSHSLDGVRSLIQLCQANGRVLAVGYNLRFLRTLQIFRQAIREGTIGRVLSFRAEVGQYLPDWRPTSDYRNSVSALSALGGGALLELSHELDYSRWIFGEPRSVQAMVRSTGTLAMDAEDLAELTVEFDGGLLGSIHLDMLSRWPTRVCRAVGTQGILTWDGIRNEVRHYSSETKTWAELHPAGPVDRNATYMAELIDFLAAIAENREPRVTGQDGLAALEIVEAARRSSVERRTVDLAEVRPTHTVAESSPNVDSTETIMQVEQAPPTRPNKRAERIVAFIFARGGSKGVPRKNLRPLAGKPLLAHSIEVARAVRGIERIIVSTDDDEIADVARRFGAEVPFRRPAELSSDKASEWLAWRHAIESIRRSEADLGFDVFLSVPTTAPLRDPEDLERAIALYRRESPDVVVTVSPAHRSPYFNMLIVDPESGRAQLPMPGPRITRRQDAPEVFDMTTVAYVADPEFILRASSLFDGDLRAAVVPTERAIDIDTPLDLAIAEFLLERAFSATRPIDGLRNDAHNLEGRGRAA